MTPAAVLRDRLKRLLDIEMSLVMLVVGAPALLLIAGAIRLVMGPPIFFRQTRPGRFGAPFTIMKFRTMKDLRDESGGLLQNDLRVTRLGRWLRATSLDELPELLNILTGTMSFVGPRPLRMEYLDYYTVPERARLRVRPGLTGLAQTLGRNALSWAAKMHLDRRYVKTHTLWLDASIVARTLFTTLRQQDVVPDGGEAFPPEWEPAREARETKSEATVQ